MTRLRSLIKEVLSQPKKKDCNCGCNDCGGKAPILTEGKVKHLISEGLQYHIDKKIQLHESVYRIGSEKHFELIREARALWVRGIIDVSEDDQAILETHLGNFGMYEDESVPLDMPMVNEEVDEDGFSDKIIKSVIKPEEVSRLSKVLNSANIPFKTEKLGKVTMFKFKSYDDVDKVEALISKNRIDIDESLNENNLLRQTNLSSEEYQKAKKLKGFNADDYTFSSDNNLYVKKESLEEGEYRIEYEDKDDNRHYIKIKASSEEEAEQKSSGLDGFRTLKSIEKIGKASLEERIDRILEAKKKKKKDPPIGKPKRGGPKAYYVYVRDPKTKRIKKVTFGSGGLRAKIRNPKARNAFAKRHRCSEKNDRTKPSYWSCRLPRYAKQLGLGSNMNTFW